MEGRPTWQVARPGAMQSMGGVTFTFEITPPMSMVETLDDGRYSP